jgi:hypothetical protein
MTREYIFTFVLILAALLLPTRGFTQKGSGSISGIVKDPTSAVVPGAKVVATLEGLDWQSAKRGLEVTTDNEGRFRFNNVPNGIYDLSVTCPEFKPEIEWGVQVQASQTTEVSFRLKFIQPCDGAPAGAAVTDSDKAEIARAVLEDALIKKTLPDWGMLVEGKDRIVLSTRNIKSNWIPRFSRFKLVLLSPRHIQERADSEGDFLHLSFSEFKVIGACVAVTIVNSWAVGKHSDMGYLSGGGSRYEFRKESGKWAGKIVSGWIS